MVLKNRKQSMESHLKQFRCPLYSTIGLERFLNKYRCFTSRAVLDIGCGCGAVTFYMADKHPDVKFIGADYNKFLIDQGRKILDNESIDNIELIYSDLFELKPSLVKDVDGIYSVHTLCCFRHIEQIIDVLVKLNPGWIAFNSLFYEGPLDVLIHIRDKENPEVKDDNPDGDFNIFSLPFTKKYFAKKGYKDFFYERFEIPEKLHKPPEGKRGTYTMKTEISPRSQFSGPVHLPWYFVLARKRV